MTRGAEMDGPVKTPEPWPPEGWPACPAPERYDAARRMLEEFKEKHGDHMPIFMDPKSIPRDMADTQILIWEQLSMAKSLQALQATMTNPEPRGLIDEFMDAWELTNPYSVGAVFITPGSTGARMVAVRTVMARDPDWTGLCLLLPRAQDMEVLMFCRGKFHDPDVVMSVPRQFLGRDPEGTPNCYGGRRMGAEGLGRTLRDVFLHHGGRVHLIDVCEKAQRVEDVLVTLMARSGG